MKTKREQENKNLLTMLLDNVRHTEECALRNGSECDCGMFTQRELFINIIDGLGFDVPRVGSLASVAVAKHTKTKNDAHTITNFLNEYVDHEGTCNSWWGNLCDCEHDILRQDVVWALKEVGVKFGQ